MPEIEILSRTPYVTVDKDRKLAPSTFVVYRDVDGKVGTIVLGKGEPRDAEIVEAIKKRTAAR